MFRIKTILILLAMSLLPIVSDAQVQKAKSYTAKVLETLPHSTDAYTQGLFFHKGRLYESSGQYGASYFREVDLKKGSTIRSFNLQSKYFGEGAVVFGERLYLLTWEQKEVLVYDINTFKQLGTLYNPKEGWGLTTDGTNLIATDGSGYIYFHDPETFRQISKIEVKLNGKSVSYLNELEYIKGEIWANVYQEDIILIINPKNGVVRATIDCKKLLHHSLRTARTDVLNGIAYNPVTNSVYLTGKYWPKMYRIALPE
ncbi:glutaminyl-peptide cyclotransferase [Bacteroidota bacterium]